MTETPKRGHGYARYKLDGCRCYTCSFAVSQYNDNRARSIAYGTWEPFVDAEPVRVHLRNMQDCGIGLRRVASAAGVDRKRLQAVLTGRPERGTGPQKQVRPDFAAAVLALEPSLDLMGSATPISAIGSQRRLQALVAAGWPQHHLAAALGWTDGNFGALLKREQVIVRTARAVRDLYDERWNADPRLYGVSRHSYTRALQHAAKNGWAPVGAWDDDTIDDPSAIPDLGEKVQRSVALVENARWLMEEHGHTREGAAVRLGVQKASLDQALHRATPVSERPPKPKWTPPQCGEPRMYRQHVARGEDCYVCRGANAAANRRYLLTGSRQEAS